jgi:hypothetical protein
MKELKNLGTVLAIAAIAALVFVVIWAYNNNSDMQRKIFEQQNDIRGLAEIIRRSETEIGNTRSGLLEVTEILKDNQKHLKKLDSKYIMSSLNAIEQALQVSDSNFTLGKKKGKKASKYMSDSEEESESEDESDIEAELRRRKKNRRRRNA